MSCSALFSVNNSPSFALHRSLPTNYSCRITPVKCVIDVRAPNTTQNPPLPESRAAEIIADEKKFIVGTYARAPLVLSSGKGCKLFDVQGREYLDLTSGIAVNALGHGDSDWLRAVTEQAEVLAHVSNVYYTVPQVKLCFFFFFLLCFWFSVSRLDFYALWSVLEICVIINCTQVKIWFLFVCFWFWVSRLNFYAVWSVLEICGIINCIVLCCSRRCGCLRHSLGEFDGLYLTRTCVSVIPS